MVWQGGAALQQLHDKPARESQQCLAGMGLEDGMLHGPREEMLSATAFARMWAQNSREAVALHDGECA